MTESTYSVDSSGVISSYTGAGPRRFRPVEVCRGCQRPAMDCFCERWRRGPSCRGRGFHCIDDICHGQGYCMHGSSCSVCWGDGVVAPERVLVVPDKQAAAIRNFLLERDLRKDKYARDDQNQLAGACYVAAEAWYHLRDSEPEVYCLSWRDVDGVPDESDATHWYLREPEGPDGGRWIDLSLSTMPPVDLPPFEQGTHRGFITGDEPSERAQRVLDAVASGDSDGD